MTSMLKMGLMTLAIGAAFHSADSSAVVASQTSFSNAVNYCQAFTPGVSNTIRNRVIGSENVGTAPIAVACNFATQMNGAAGNTQLHDIAIYFSNGGTTDATMSCTFLAGTSAGVSSGAAYTVTKTALVPAGNAYFLSWDATDNPTAGSTDFGNLLVGVNCILPPKMTLGATVISWDADNGV